MGTSADNPKAFDEPVNVRESIFKDIGNDAEIGVNSASAAEVDGVYRWASLSFKKTSFPFRKYYRFQRIVSFSIASYIFRNTNRLRYNRKLDRRIIPGKFYDYTSWSILGY